MAIRVYTRHPKTWEDLPLIMTTNDLSSLFDVDARTVRKMCENGAIPARKVSKQWRVNRERLREFLNGDVQSNAV